MHKKSRINKGRTNQKSALPLTIQYFHPFQYTQNLFPPIQFSYIFNT